MSITWYFIILPILFVYSTTLKLSHIPQSRYCHDKRELLTYFTNQSSIQTIFVHEFSDVSLQCRRCNETFHFGQTIDWYKQEPSVDDTFYEHLTSHRYKFSEVGSILIENVTKSNDSGIYFCQIGGRNVTEVAYDVQVFNPITYKNMTLTEVMMYVNETTLVVNDVLQAKHIVKCVVGYHVTQWTRCFCRSNETKMRSHYLCYVKILDTNERIYQCHDENLSQDYEDVYLYTKTLENFSVQRLCYDCLPLYHKSHKQLKFKSLLHKHVVEGESLKVGCVSNTRLNDVIRWVKDNSVYYDAGYNSLGTGQYERHIGVDMLGELLISKVIPEDKGVYVCFFNGEPILKMVLKIFPKDVEDTEEFKDGLEQLTYLFIACFLLWIPYGIYIYRK